MSDREASRRSELDLCRKVEREAYPDLAQLENEFREIRAIANSHREAERKIMDYTVDAGEIFANVRAVSPRDSAHLVLAELGDRARFPITVLEKPTGESFTFVLENLDSQPPAAPDPGSRKPPARAAAAKHRKARA